MANLLDIIKSCVAGLLGAFENAVSWFIAHFEVVITWITEVVGQLGYLGIVMLMFLESSFFPFPSEVVLPPAGYLASQGQMRFSIVVLCGVLGSVLGALFNYWIAVRWGRYFFDRYGKYFFVGADTLDKAELFFKKHGHISTFICRLLPVIRQYVSLPAGLARMPLLLFSIYTALGSAIWVVILTFVGYWVGQQKELVHAIMQQVTIVLIVSCTLIVCGYIYWHKKVKNRGVPR